MPNEPEGTPPLPSYRPMTELDPEVRRRALQRLEERKAFRIHVTVYLAVMVFLTGIWLVSSGGREHYWPIWPMMAWGLGIALHFGSLFWDKEPTEEQIAAEAQKIRKQLGQDIPRDD